MGDETDRAALARDLNAALGAQLRSAMQLAVAAGTVPGVEGVGLSPRLHAWAADELHDAERIAARVASLGTDPSLDTGEMSTPKAWTMKAMLRWLADGQRQSIELLVKAIPADADDAEGEATEHLLEHAVSRKRDVLEALERALR